MTSALLDASALLAYLQGEPGEDTVEGLLEAGAACSAVNYAEVAQKVQARGRNWATVANLLESYRLRVEPATAADAVKAADLWQEAPHLSLADRFCLATAHRLSVPAWTTDRAWGSSDAVKQIR